MSRKLDAALAKALGEDVRWYVCVGYGTQGDRYYIAEPHKPGAKPYLHTRSGSRLGDVPHYSTDGNDTLQLDKEMRERGFGVSISRHGEGEWKACWWKESDPFGMCEATTMSRALALSAYRALTGKEWTK